ncbi:hypothetical protein RND71_008465 [Anisodus tanguticus]|uniref:Uncharacterized protein n=1 Tax=Anisodus tanguticus TaxID=243964 RepID=A0AAE1SNW4_9SOLA|nr:hypothetical protein RND71_008465 [Anisodus tanguticus]
MGGKGKKRREKNYRAVHGGTPRLPPPPTPSSIDAVPSKLRQLMAFSGDGKASLDNAERKKGDGGGSANGKEVMCSSRGNSLRQKCKRIRSEDQVQAKNAGNKRKDDKSSLSGAAAAELNAQQKRNKKRKRKEVKDLRFDTAELGITSSKRKERKKQRLAEMKKKHKKGNTDENMDFPGREEIKFGEVVEAPPKLVVPKAFKNNAHKNNAHDASKERLRLQAVEAYRQRKGWTSRLGIQISPLVIESPLV